jgi:uncharacterized protein
MKLEPFTVTGRPFIESYGAAGFRVDGAEIAGAVLILPDGPRPWDVSGIAEVGEASLAPVMERHDVEVLLIGSGRRMVMLAKELRARLRQAGIGLEVMDTGAACRTFNVLLGENRRVAAALLPVES